MSIPSGLDSPFSSCNDVMDSPFSSCNDVIENCNGRNVFSSNPFRSTQPVEYPTTHDTQHTFLCNFVDGCNSATPAGHFGLSNPVLKATFCSSSHTNDVQSQGWVSSDQMKHKMTERQRRKDMNSLISILKSLLPEENLQGKRAVSDQVREAVKYVQHLQQKVEDLSIERDKMKVNSVDTEKKSLEDVRLSCKDKFCSKAPSIGESNEEFPTVKIKSVGSDYQVLMNTFEHQIVYSDLLMALEDGGLEVVCAASSSVNSRVYHTIYTQDGWCDSQGILEEVRAKLQMRQEGAIKYERAISYALFHQSLVQLENVKCVAPATIVNSMPISTFDGNKSEQGSIDEMEKCAICQFEYEFGDQIISLPCTHSFHNHYGAEWFLNHSKLCPICKHDVMDQKPVDIEFGP